MADEQRRPPRFEERACAFCGEAFRTSEPTKRYCSAICRLKANQARVHQRKRPAPPKQEG